MKAETSQELRGLVREVLKEAMAKLTAASHKVAEAMYKGAAQHGEAHEEEKKEGDVVEAEVVDDQQKK